jgi:GTPase SAR1 family protein
LAAAAVSCSGNTLGVLPTSTVRRNSVNCLTSSSGAAAGSNQHLPLILMPNGGERSRRHSMMVVVDPGNVDLLQQQQQSSRRGSVRSTACAAGSDVIMRTSGSGLSNVNVSSSTSNDLIANVVGLLSLRNDVSAENGNGGEEDDEIGDAECEEDGGGLDGERGGGGAMGSRLFKVMVLGSHGVGKTTLVQQLLTSEYLANAENEQDDDNSDVHIVSVQLDDEESMVQFIDTHNADETPMIDDGLDVDAYLVVYSVTDRGSFQYAQSCLQILKRRRTSRSFGSNNSSAVVLVANKQDLVRNRVISENDGKRLGSKRHCKFIEASALLDHKVDEVLVAIIREARQHESKHPTATTAAAAARSSDDDDDAGRGKLGCFHRAAASFAFCRKLFK